MGIPFYLLVFLTKVIWINAFLNLKILLARTLIKPNRFLLISEIIYLVFLNWNIVFTLGYVCAIEAMIPRNLMPILRILVIIHFKYFLEILL